MTRTRKYTIITVIVVVVLGLIAFFAGPKLYVEFFEGDQPAALSLPAATPAAGTADADIDGTWTIGTGSMAGYNVHEDLRGTPTDVRGRTSNVTGSLTIADNQLTAGNVVVDVASIATDSGNRDRQFRSNVMDSTQFPTATFAITSPVDLSTLPSDGTKVSLPISGTLTLRGVTEPVTATFDVQRSGAALQAAGAVDIAFADYSVPLPSVLGITVENQGQVEFLISATK